MMGFCILVSMLAPPLAFALLKAFGLLAWPWMWVVWFPLIATGFWFCVIAWCLLCVSSNDPRAKNKESGPASKTDGKLR